MYYNIHIFVNMSGKVTVSIPYDMEDTNHPDSEGLLVPSLQVLTYVVPNPVVYMNTYRTQHVTGFCCMW